MSKYRFRVCKTACKLVRVYLEFMKNVCMFKVYKKPVRSVF